MRCGAEHSVHYRRKLNMRYRQIAACPMRLYALTSLDSGYRISAITRVSSRFGLPAGGYQMQFPYPVPPQFISVVR